MNYTNLLDEVMKIPEVKTEYNRQIKEDIIDEKAGMHIVFGYVFAPLLIDAITNNQELTKRLFLFVEQMSSSNDTKVQEVCDFSILEAICDEYSDDVLLPFLGEKTLEGYNEVRKYVGT